MTRLPERERVVSVVRQPDKIVVLDARSGFQQRYVVPLPANWKQLEQLEHRVGRVRLTVYLADLTVAIRETKPRTKKPPRETPYTTPCQHLGAPIERDGITLKVRCGCSGQEKEQTYAVHRCEIHKRCLPGFRPTEEQRAKFAEGVESDVQLFQWCHGCADRVTVAALV